MGLQGIFEETKKRGVVFLSSEKLTLKYFEVISKFPNQKKNIYTKRHMHVCFVLGSSQNIGRKQLLHGDLNLFKPIPSEEFIIQPNYTRPLL